MRRSLTVLVSCAVALPALALPAASAQPVDSGGPVVVASLVRTADGGIEVRRTRADSPAKGRSLAARLRSQPGVVDAALDTTVTAFALPTADPLQDQQWALPAIQAEQAWAGGDATGQVVAIIDSGVDVTHPDLAGALVPGYDYVESDPVPDDDNGHGTHVAGIVAAVAGNGVGVAGVAWRGKVMPIKVLDAEGSGSSSHVAAAVRLAVESGADVINLSLGGATPSTMLSNAISDALAAGVPVVAAAGNQSSSTPSYPAAQPGVIAVGAVDRTLTHASFSNTGTHLALVGPGVGIQSTTQRTEASPSGYGRMSGTSMATPHVSSVLALLRAAAPRADLSQLYSALVATARDLGPAGHDSSYGAGLVDAAAARDHVVAATAPLPEPEPTPEPTVEPTPEPTAEPSPEPTPEATPTAEPTDEPDLALEPVKTPPTSGPAPAEPEPVTGPSARTLDGSCPVGTVPPNPFADIATASTHERAISCLVWWRVANGKSATSYAPSLPVTREEMAAFVARAVLAARPGSLPAAPPNAFRDDDGSVHRLSIDQLAAAGIVGGTGGGTYSPRAVVTRGQMARFLANAAAHVLGTPLPAGRDLFSDDTGSLFEADINRVATAGLTGGYADGTYRPGGTVLRDQMGSFLARTLDLYVVEGGASIPR